MFLSGTTILEVMLECFKVKKCKSKAAKLMMFVKGAKDLVVSEKPFAIGSMF